MKTIKNPVTSKVYKVKEHSNKYDPNKKIEGLWSEDMICTDYFKPSKADTNILFLYSEEINEDDYKEIDVTQEVMDNAYLALMKSAYYSTIRR